MTLKINQSSKVVALHLYTKIAPILIIVTVIMLLMDGEFIRFVTAPWSIFSLLLCIVYICYEYLDISTYVTHVRIDVFDDHVSISYRRIFRKEEISILRSEITHVFTQQGVIERFLGISKIGIITSGLKPVIMGGFDVSEAHVLRDTLEQSITLQ